MDLRKPNGREEMQNERLVLFNRLIKQKDAILTATQNIEDLRKRYVQANKKDEDGVIESEIQKRLYTIISALSELTAYMDNAQEFSKILIEVAQWVASRRIAEKSPVLSGDTSTEAGVHIAQSRMLDAVCVCVNTVHVELRLKKEPLVNIQNLESLVQMKLSGNK
jgi:hypothetical protein